MRSVARRPQGDGYSTRLYGVSVKRRLMDRRLIQTRLPQLKLRAHLLASYFMSTECLFEGKGSAPCDAAANRYKDLVGPGPKGTCTEIIGILALGAVYAEVRSAVRFHKV